MIDQNAKAVWFVVESTRWIAPDDVVLRLTGIGDRDAAEAIVHRFVDIDPLAPPEGLTDIADTLIGAQVEDAATGRTLGSVIAIEDNGAQPMLVIEQPNGDERLVPFVDAFVASVGRNQLAPTGGTALPDRDSSDPEVTPEGRVLRLNLIPGLFDDDAPDAGDVH